MGIGAAGPTTSQLDGRRREVDAKAVEAPLVGDLEEEPGATTEVEQSAPAALGEHGTEGVHDDPIPTLPVFPIAPGEELAIAPAGIEIAKPRRLDAGVAIEKAAPGTTHDVVVPAPALAVVWPQQGLEPWLAAERAGHWLLDLADAGLLEVLRCGNLGGTGDHPFPAALVEPRRPWQGAGPKRAWRQSEPAGSSTRAAGESAAKRSCQRLIRPARKAEAPTAATTTPAQKRAPLRSALAARKAVTDPIRKSGSPTSQRQLTAERPGGVRKLRLIPHLSRATMRS